jgi:hypothetical protein
MFTRAFNMISQDKDWVSKLLIALVITAFAALFSAAIIGLAGWAILLGWQVQLIRNVRLERPHPLPAWDDIGGFLNMGIAPLIAVIVYQLPTLVLGIALGAVFTIGGSGWLSGTLSIVCLCCTLPVVIAYALISSGLLVVGMGRYADDPRLGVFFEVADLWGVLRDHMEQTLAWYGNTLVILLIVSALALIPCIGWAAQLALLIPLTGAVSALYIAEVLPAAPKPPAEKARRSPR